MENFIEQMIAMGFSRELAITVSSKTIDISFAMALIEYKKPMVDTLIGFGIDPELALTQSIYYDTAEEAADSIYKTIQFRGKRLGSMSANDLRPNIKQNPEHGQVPIKESQYVPPQNRQDFIPNNNNSQQPDPRIDMIYPQHNYYPNVEQVEMPNPIMYNPFNNSYYHQEEIKNEITYNPINSHYSNVEQAEMPNPMINNPYNNYNQREEIKDEIIYNPNGNFNIYPENDLASISSIYLAPQGTYIPGKDVVYTDRDEAISYMLDEFKHPLSKDKLSNIKIFKINNENLLNEECSICLNKYSQSDMLSQLKCNHIFHKECIEKHFSFSSKCPLDNVEL